MQNGIKNNSLHKITQIQLRKGARLKSKTTYIQLSLSSFSVDPQSSQPVVTMQDVIDQDQQLRQQEE